MSNAKANRLIHESSPYLRQHAHNPVDWYPWGPEALQKAKREQKPIFLSIGYSACHWCHVMENESFTDAEIAKQMNASFINIKVDREERPDLDHIYMSAVQVMTQHGGWPMSVFLTPELEPFYGGTYFPPDDRMGMPGFKKVLLGVANAWNSRRDEVTRSARQLCQALEQMGNTPDAPSGTSRPVSRDLATGLAESAYRAISDAFDAENGGFGRAPKFFHTMNIKMALRHWTRTRQPAALQLATFTLDRWLGGGIFDQLGGGFHRYSTDATWLVPHFEKMLYDNALITEVYLEAYQATRKIEYSTVARETLDYVLREMTAPEGGFYSTQDADSEGHEGKFYVWSHQEISEALDNDLAEQFCETFDVTKTGNWEGQNILHLPHSLEQTAQNLKIEREWLEDSLATAKRKLFALRSTRVAPFRDEKVLVSWNGLMIDTMAKGYQVLGDERYLAAARAAARFILEKMTTLEKPAAGTPPLYHVHKDGLSRLTAYLDDYACFINALVSLYEADFDPLWLRKAKALAEIMLRQFWDENSASLYFTAHDHEKLILRPKEMHDGATPSGSAMAVTALFRLGRLLENQDFLKKAEKALQQALPLLESVPLAAGQWLVALDFISQRPQEIVVATGESSEEWESALRIIRDSFLPNKVVAMRRPDDDVKSVDTLIPLLSQRPSKEKKVTVYICENYSCQAPLVGTDALEAALKP